MADTYLYRQCDATADSGYSTTWTWSGWVKRSRLGSPEQGIFMNKKDSDNTASRFRMSFGSNHRLLWECKDSTNSDDNSFQTNMEFKDTNAWYHIVFSYDSTQGTEANRLKLWVNGVDIRNDGGGFASIDEASNGFGTLWSSASKHYLGRTSNNSGTAHYFDGYMSHVHLTYGTTYPASTFGSTDATTGEWKINTNPNVTYGSQGYFMLKNDNSVNDDSGEGNNFTLGGGTLTKSEDNPSNVFATFNPLDNYYPAMTLSYGNTRAVTIQNKYTYTPTTLGMTSGKYYAEIKCTAQSASQDAMVIGITSTPSGATTHELGHFANDWGYYADSGGYRNNDTTTSYGAVWTHGAIICIAVDLDNNKLYFRRDGNAWENSGDPTSGSTGTGAISITDPASTPRGAYFFAVNNWSSTTTATFDANFGNGYFGTTAVSSAGTNASGNGLFEYDVPTGYTALSTKGLNL
jgi:hypothetical protein